MRFSLPSRIRTVFTNFVHTWHIGRHLYRTDCQNEMTVLCSTHSTIKKSAYVRNRRHGAGTVADAPRALPDSSLATSSLPPVPAGSVNGGVNSQPQAPRAGSDIRAAAQLDTNPATLSFSSSCALTDTFEPRVCNGAVNTAVEERAQAVVALEEHEPPRTVKRTLAEILALSIPALGSTLADPLCSLVDTALVGQVSSLQLAALSPCTAIFNLAFLVRVLT